MAFTARFHTFCEYFLMTDKPRIFDTEFHELQLRRYATTAQKDIVFERVNEIIEFHIATLRDVFKAEIGSVYHTHSTLPNHPVDLVISNLELHYENDPIERLKELKTLVKPGGWLVVTLLGQHTLYQLRRILEATELELKGGVSPRVIPMIDIKDAGTIAQRAGFAEIITDVESLEVEYRSFEDMINHPRKLGQANALLMRETTYVGRNFFANAAKNASRLFPESLVNTFDILSIVAKV